MEPDVSDTSRYRTDVWTHLTNLVLLFFSPDIVRVCSDVENDSSQKGKLQFGFPFRCARLVENLIYLELGPFFYMNE